MVHQTFTQSNCYAFKMWTFSKVYEYWANDFQPFAVLCIHTANGGILIQHIKNIDMTDMTLKEQPLNLHFFVVQGLKCHPFHGFKFSLYMSNPGSETQVVLPPPLKTPKNPVESRVSYLARGWTPLDCQGTSRCSQHPPLRKLFQNCLQCQDRSSVWWEGHLRFFCRTVHRLILRFFSKGGSEM